MTCEGERNGANAMSARPTLGLLPQAACKAVIWGLIRLTSQIVIDGPAHL